MADPIPWNNTNNLTIAQPTAPQPTQPAQPTTAAQSTTSSGLDPNIVNVAKAIRSTETSLQGDFTAHGKSGEYGAYQFTQPTWDAVATKIGIKTPYNQASPQEQNAVAYSYIKDLKDKGNNVGQIASIWNSGKSDPNATGTGVNKMGATYDVPGYVNKVYKTYQQLKGQTPQGKTDTQQTPTQPQSIGQQIVGGAKAVGNFLFPIVGDVYHDVTGTNTKTALQQAGDLGVSALGAATLIPGIGPEALAARAGLVGSEGLGLAGRLGVNAALGAGYGATGALGAGQTDPSQILQSAGTGAVLGGALGGVGEYASSKLSGLANKGESRLTTLAGKTKALSTSFADNSRAATADGLSAATTPIKTLQTTMTAEGKPLASLLTVDGNRVNVDALTNELGTGELDSQISGHAEDASALIKTLPGGVPITDFETQIMGQIDSNPDIRGAGRIPQARAQAQKMIDSFKLSYGDTIPYPALDEMRVKMNRFYDPAESDVNKVFGDVARSNLYNGSGTNTAIKSAMANEAELIRARNFAQKLNRAVVPGGQLGKYLADMAGAYGGGLVGGAVGGPFGAGLGYGVGGFLTNKGVQIAQRNYFTPIGSRTAGRLSSALNTTAGSVAKGTAKAAALRALTQ